MNGKDPYDGEIQTLDAYVDGLIEILVGKPKDVRQKRKHRDRRSVNLDVMYDRRKSPRRYEDQLVHVCCEDGTIPESWQGCNHDRCQGRKLVRREDVKQTKI